MQNENVTDLFKVRDGTQNFKTTGFLLSRQLHHWGALSN